MSLSRSRQPLLLEGVANFPASVDASQLRIIRICVSIVALFCMAGTTPNGLKPRENLYVFYQGATFARHPETSVAWIVGMLALFSVTILTLRRWGMRKGQRPFDAVADAA